MKGRRVLAAGRTVRVKKVPYNMLDALGAYGQHGKVLSVRGAESAYPVSVKTEEGSIRQFRFDEIEVIG